MSHLCCPALWLMHDAVLNVLNLSYELLATMQAQHVITALCASSL